MRFAPTFATKAARRDATPNENDRPVAQRQPAYPQAVNRKDRPYQDSWTIERAVELAFLRSVWVYRSCVAIATNQAKLQIVARKGDWVDGKIVESSVADRLNFNPTRNRAFNSTIFRRMTSFQVLLNRQGAMQEVTPTNSGELYSLNLFPPNYCWPIPHPTNYVEQYMLRYPGVPEFPIDAERVVWIREPHPTDIYAGISPLEPLGLSVETDWYQRLYNRNFILNDARPGGFLVLKAGDTLDPDDWADIRSRFGNGPQAAGRFEILDGENAQWIDGATTPRDAQYAELRKAVRDEILEGFGVPESIAGNASNRTFANADAEREVFWGETMLPHLELLARAWDQLTPEDDIFISFDWTRVPILERDIREQREKKFRDFQAGAISLDEYRVDGLGKEPAASGKTDRLYVGVSLQEVGSTTDDDWQDPSAPPEDGGFGGDTGFGAAPPPPGDGSTFPEAQTDELGPAEDVTSTFADDFFAKSLGWTEKQRKALIPPTGHDDGIMIAFKVPPPIARQLYIEGGEPARDMHITLCYLGRATDVEAPDQSILASAVATWAKLTPSMVASLSGPARFDQGSKTALVALVDAPGLAEARTNLTRILDMAGITYSEDHDFTPHITRAYADPGETIPDLPEESVGTWELAQACLVWRDQWVEIPLEGPDNYAKAIITFESKDGPKRFEVKDELKSWLSHHGAWETTIANALESTFEAQERIVLEKLQSARNDKAYKAYLAERATDE